MATRTDKDEGWTRSAYAGTAATLFLFALAYAAAQAGWLQTFDFKASDSRAAFNEYGPTGRIALVDLDARSLRDIGVWPWPRDLHARLLTQADKAGAHAVAFDIDFSARGGAEADEAFAQALAHAQAQTFLAAFAQEASVGSPDQLVSMPTPALLDMSWPAAVNVPLDRDGRVRRFASEVETPTERLASMPALLSDTTPSEAFIGINFSIDAGSIPRVSYVDLLEGRVPRDVLEGRSLIVGATAIELRDFFRVPNHGVVSGSTVIALAAETLIQNLEMTSLPAPPWSYALLAALAVAALLCFGSRAVLVVAPAAMLALEAFALWLHHASQLDVQTAGLQLGLCAVVLVAVLQAFDLKSVLLSIARVDASNSELMLERVIEDGFDAVVVFDAEGLVVRSNAAARDLPLWDGRRGVPCDLAGFPTPLKRAVEAAFGDRVHTVRVTRDVDLAGGNDRCILEYSLVPLELERHARRGAGAAGNRLMCLTLRDVTRVRLAQDEMRALALRDALTGLCNRRGLEMLVAERAARGAASSIVLFDLDRFEEVNDLLGHGVGDLVLHEVARRAEAIFGADAILARIGGDKFAAVLDCVVADELGVAAAALKAAIEAPIVVSGHRMAVSIACGVTVDHAHEGDLRRILTQADLALHHAKQAGGPLRTAFFAPAMEVVRHEKLELEREFTEAVAGDRFELVYQPQVDMSSGRVVGAEALLRWNHPVRGPISPQRFIPLAEETGLIHRLGSWALLQACRDAMDWPADVSVAVNVSSVQLQVGDLVEVVESVIEATGIDPARLELEITESAFVRDGPELAGIFERLRAIGIRFALDDFGTGYSSLGYLHRFPISKIKIDKSFVDGLPTSGSSLAIVRSVMALASGLGIRCIAEGIEQVEQAESLSLFGCREGQGYLFHRPLNAVAMLDIFRQSVDVRAA